MGLEGGRKTAEYQALGSPKRVTSPAPAPQKPPEQVSPGVFKAADGRMSTNIPLPTPDWLTPLSEGDWLGAVDMAAWRRIVDHRGGCRCHLSPPCSACSDPITEAELNDEGFTYGAACTGE